MKGYYLPSVYSGGPRTKIYNKAGPAASLVYLPFLEQQF